MPSVWLSDHRLFQMRNWVARSTLRETTCPSIGRFRHLEFLFTRHRSFINTFSAPTREIRRWVSGFMLETLTLNVHNVWGNVALFFSRSTLYFFILLYQLRSFNVVVWVISILLSCCFKQTEAKPSSWSHCTAAPSNADGKKPVKQCTHTVSRHEADGINSWY